MDRAPEVKFEITWFGERVRYGKTDYGVQVDRFFGIIKAVFETSVLVLAVRSNPLVVKKRN